jgi:hypothetical protein
MITVETGAVRRACARWQRRSGDSPLEHLAVGVAVDYAPTPSRRPRADRRALRAARRG